MGTFRNVWPADGGYISECIHCGAGVNTVKEMFTHRCEEGDTVIRFVDLTSFYWSDDDNQSPVCAFLDTINNRFIETWSNGHTFTTLQEIKEHSRKERLMQLVPVGFFDRKV